MNELADTRKFWKAVLDILAQLDEELPFTDPPEVYGRGDPDFEAEAFHIQDQYAAHEYESRKETLELLHNAIETYCAKNSSLWPKNASPTACYFAGLRIGWAVLLVRQLCVETSTHELPFGRPRIAGKDFLHWLVSEAYDEQHLVKFKAMRDFLH